MGRDVNRLEEEACSEEELPRLRELQQGRRRELALGQGGGGEEAAERRGQSGLALQNLGFRSRGGESHWRIQSCGVSRVGLGAGDVCEEASLSIVVVGPAGPGVCSAESSSHWRQHW